MNLPNFMNEEAIAMDVFGALDESFRKTNDPGQLLKKLKEVIDQKEDERNGGKKC